MPLESSQEIGSAIASGAINPGTNIASIDLVLGVPTVRAIVVFDPDAW